MDNRINDAFDAVSGIAAGWASYRYLPTLISRSYGKIIASEFRKVDCAENDVYWSAAQKALESSGLKGKGVEIVDVNKDNYENVIEDLWDKRKNNSENLKENKKGLLSWLRRTISEPNDAKAAFEAKIKMLSEGRNATFFLASNKIVLNKEKRGFSVFHEMGHAINANFIKGKKWMLKEAALLKYGIPFLLAASLITKREQEDKAKPSKVNQGVNILKDNVGLLTFACWMPRLIEEGMASVNGTKLAKNILKPEELKKMNRLQFKAWTTYLALALSTGLVAQFAVHIKDKLARPSQSENLKSA